MKDGRVIYQRNRKNKNRMKILKWLRNEKNKGKTMKDLAASTKLSRETIRKHLLEIHKEEELDI